MSKKIDSFKQLLNVSMFLSIFSSFSGAAEASYCDCNLVYNYDPTNLGSTNSVPKTIVINTWSWTPYGCFWDAKWNAPANYAQSSNCCCWHGTKDCWDGGRGKCTPVFPIKDETKPTTPARLPKKVIAIREKSSSKTRGMNLK